MTYFVCFLSDRGGSISTGSRFMEFDCKISFKENINKWRQEIVAEEGLIDCVILNFIKMEGGGE